MTDHMRGSWASALNPHLVSPARLRAQVLDSRRSSPLDCWFADGQASALPAAASALAAVAERRRAAEIVALEKKLSETKQRHAEELARLAQAAKSSDDTCFFHNDPHGVPLSGPVLATRRRTFGRQVLRLWVEDCSALSTARIHAMDEASGFRLHVDIPDHALSSMLRRFRLMKSQMKAETMESETSFEEDDSGHVDTFLHALLDAVYLVGPLSPHGSLQLHLPTAFSHACAASREAELSAASQATQWAQRWTPSSSSIAPGITFGGQSCARGVDLYTAAELESISRRFFIEDFEKAPPTGPPPSAWELPIEEQVVPPMTPTPPAVRPGLPGASRARGTPSLRRSGPDGGRSYSTQRGTAVQAATAWEQTWGGAAPVAAHSAPSAPMRASAVEAHSGHMPSSAPTPSKPVSQQAALVERQPAGRPPCRPATASAASPSKPSQRRPARPHSAPHGARRPQSARPRGRDQAAEGCSEWRPAPPPLPPQDAASRDAVARRRRARPTSAKATKHRRVVDDGLDSIIYEDFEEETEEASEQWEAAIAGFQDATVAPAGPARSGTGGCGSCASSSRAGSLSSRSQSRSRHPGSRSHRSSEHSSERRTQSVEPDRREQTEAEASSRGALSISGVAPGARGSWSRPSSAGARSEEINSSAFDDTGLLKLSVTSGDGELEEDVLNGALEEEPTQGDLKTSSADSSSSPVPRPLPSERSSAMTATMEKALEQGGQELPPAGVSPSPLPSSSRPHMTPMSMSEFRATPVPSPPRVFAGAGSEEQLGVRSFAETWPGRGPVGLHRSGASVASCDGLSCAPALVGYGGLRQASQPMGGARADGDVGSALGCKEVANGALCRSSRALGSGPRASSPPPPPRFARSTAVA